MTDLLIHIGYPKTGTTWLQNNLFGKQELGFYTPWGNCAEFAIEQFVLKTPFAFDAESTFLEFEDKLVTGKEKGLCPVLSNELLIGNLVNHTYWGEMALERIRKTFADIDIKILLTIREQKSFILSSYREYIRGGGTLPLNQYFELESKRAGWRPPLSIEFLEYDKIVNYLHKLFGKENVLVLFFEEFKKEKDEFIHRIYKLSGLPDNFDNLVMNEYNTMTNYGNRGLGLKFRRFMNNFVSQADWNKQSKPISLRITNKVSSFISNSIPNVNSKLESQYKEIISSYVGSRFVESNTNLLALLDLEELPEEYVYECSKAKK